MRANHRLRKLEQSKGGGIHVGMLECREGHEQTECGTTHAPHRAVTFARADYQADEDFWRAVDARTLALGTMMLRQSRAKALVDASYNRFAWNDPEDLPDWFLDDENRHYRPQLPIPQALIDKIKAKQLALSARPIAKVAEARARKNKKAKVERAAAPQVPHDAVQTTARHSG